MERLFEQGTIDKPGKYMKANEPMQVRVEQR